MFRPYITNRQQAILGRVGQAVFAVSMTRLHPSHSKWMTVRRSSDNAEQLIGFRGLRPDYESLLAFVGADDGYVVAWHSPDNIGINATQVTAAKQPLIVNAGVLLDGPRFDGADESLDIETNASFAFGTGAFSMMAVVKMVAEDQSTSTPYIIDSSNIRLHTLVSVKAMRARRTTSNVSPSSPIDIFTGNLTFVLANFNVDGEIDFYADGVFDDAATGDTGNVTQPVNMKLNKGSLNATIQAAAIFSRALPQPQVSYLHNKIFRAPYIQPVPLIMGFAADEMLVVVTDGEAQCLHHPPARPGLDLTQFAGNKFEFEDSAGKIAVAWAADPDAEVLSAVIGGASL